MQRNSRLLPSSEITLGNLQAGKPEAAPHAHDPRPIFQYEQHLLDTVVRPEPSLFKPVIGRVIMFRPHDQPVKGHPVRFKPLGSFSAHLVTAAREYVDAVTRLL